MMICVVGGGPAGMMAAIAAAENGNKVTLIEQNEKLGKKLFLTGKGRCNITNACPVEELFDNITSNPKFMYSSIYCFDNSALADSFERWGLPLKTERGQRVFPKSDHSSDVIKTLSGRLESLGVNVMLSARVIEYVFSDSDAKDSISGVIISKNGKKKKIVADRIIMATGGCSYPLTGSDGTSFTMLERMGLKISPPEPSLVPFSCSDRTVTDMQGLALKNVGITVKCQKNSLYTGFGEMLFTHFGISGPLVLSASSYIRQQDYAKGIKVFLDLKPALDHAQLDERIIRDFDENKNKDFANSLGKLLPGKIITAVIKRTGIDPSKKVNVITRAERQKLVDVLKNFEIDVTGNRGFDEAIITRGGVAVSEIDPSTMECKKIKGLYFAGEMIDVDALTGGFNLQIAWSTGHLAGNSCKEDKNE